MPGNNVTLYVQWQGNPHTLSFNLNGGSGTAPGNQTVNTGGVETTVTDSTWFGYTFLPVGIQQLMAVA
ncbi:hypothetical protein AZF37_07690 [endosymbiont 'TC1' of Trimyema compressum]|uniref:hypothetical protein n=1 Tax=endosymbiont 'TC1' of Trimyema compressum TaxID=243899 RepID=UPI0007F14D7B|nr:hypothetical protein [endosymbiont 'TC1' of Trimyema compressum]AMP21061.1 hypothetical protein AZF37_07690 [endosymbiont 'TC1' of Trimyema compressum]